MPESLLTAVDGSMPFGHGPGFQPSRKFITEWGEVLCGRCATRAVLALEVRTDKLHRLDKPGARCERCGS